MNPEYKTQYVCLTDKSMPCIGMHLGYYSDGRMMEPSLSILLERSTVGFDITQDTPKKLRMLADMLDVAWAMYREGQK
jgi:hypothetical protein